MTNPEGAATGWMRDLGNFTVELSPPPQARFVLQHHWTTATRHIHNLTDQVRQVLRMPTEDGTTPQTEP